MSGPKSAVIRAVSRSSQVFSSIVGFANMPRSALPRDQGVERPAMEESLTAAGRAGFRRLGLPTVTSTRRTALTIALTRHGQTDWNAAGRLQGSSDVPLNDTGRGQAAESVQRFSPADWDAVVTSPLSRARETGAILADGLGIPLGATYPELVERHYGVAEGLTDGERSEEHTSELQSRQYLVCRLLLEK